MNKKVFIPKLTYIKENEAVYIKETKPIRKMGNINLLIEKTGAEVTDDINEYLVDEYDDKGERIVQSKRFSAIWEEIR